MSGKLEYLISAAKGEVEKILIEEAAPVLVSEMLKGTVFDAVAGAAGAVVPGVGNLMLTYKQKKLEKNFEIYVSKIIEKQDEINGRLERLEESRKEEIRSNYFGLVADYASQSRQEAKIEYMVNGLVNIAGNVLFQEDAVLMYYDTLDQLNMLDLRILKIYMHPAYLEGKTDGDNIPRIMEECSLDWFQINMIKEKLARLGLLESRNDADMDENIRNMAQYLEDAAKGKKNAKLKRLKKINKSESYQITPYGRKLFLFFSEVSECAN